MIQRMRLVRLLVLIGVLAACEPGPVAIPPGAQQVQVTATPTTITLQPASVAAGDVYLVLNLSAGATELELVRIGTGGLSDAQIARLQQTGDAGVGSASEGLSVSCCGNVVKETLVAGNYPILLPGPSGSAAVVPPITTAILHVTP